MPTEAHSFHATLSPDLLRGVSVADRTRPIVTLHQLGGTGEVWNKALAIPFHLGNNIGSLEYVAVQPLSTVGEHTQVNDEMYYLVQGAGELITNGVSCWVKAGDLVIAPRQTRHTIRNLATHEPLTFLVVEVRAPASPFYRPQVIEALPALLQPESEAYPALVGRQHVPIRIARAALQTLFGGPWGLLTLLEIPPGCRLEPYGIAAYDENLFVINGHASIALDGYPKLFRTGEDATHSLNVLVPARLQRQITNCSSREPLMVLSVQVCHS